MEPEKKRVKVDFTVNLSHDLEEGLAEAYLNQQLSDCILVIEGHRFPVSRFYLSLQSNYFKTLFSQNFKEWTEKEIELKDVDFQWFQLLYQFVYMKKTNLGQLNHEELIGLFSISDQLDFSKLSDKILEFLETLFNRTTDLRTHDINLDLALKWLSISQICGKKDLEVTIKSCLALNAHQMIGGAVHGLAPLDVLQKVLSSNTFYAKEMDIFKFIGKWLSNREEEGEQKRTLSEAAYGLVRFSLISEEDKFEADIYHSIQGLNIDFKQHYGKYRGSLSWSPVGFVAGEERTRYSGPTVADFGLEPEKGSVWLRFDRPYAFNWLKLGIGWSCSPLQLNFKFDVCLFSEERPSGEITCNQLTTRGLNGYHVNIFSQTPIIASKVSLFTRFSSDIFSFQELIVKKKCLDWSEKGSVLCELEVSQNNHENVTLVDPKKLVFVIGLQNNDASRRLDFSHCVPSQEGTTFLFLQTFLLDTLFIFLQASDQVTYDFDVMLSEDGTDFRLLRNLLQVSGEVTVNFEPQTVSGVRLVGKSIHNSNDEQFKLNGLRFDLAAKS